MCGIIGYLGNKKSLPIIMEGLEKMEYRGYDSSGVALLENRQLTVIKKQGKLSNLKKEIEGKDFVARLGLGHTRWATHGEPSDLNAHPHTDCQQQIAVVHNGIIENMQELKEELLREGHVFASQTDSEIFAHLIETYSKEIDLLQAIKKSLQRVRGAYGLAVMSVKKPDTIIVARSSSPLILGVLPEGGYMVASDVTALLPFTDQVVYIEDGEVVEIFKDRYVIHKEESILQPRQPHRVDWQSGQAQKEGFEHFMLKEIMEAPSVVKNSLAGRIILEEGNVKFGGLIDILPKLKNAKRIIFVACGTSYYATMIGEYLLESQVGIPVEVEYASEFRYKDHVLDQGTVVIALSQSGETADTLAALRQAKALGALTLALVNVVGSSLSREADAGIYYHIGPEISVASTKALISQITILVLFSVLFGRQRTMTQGQAQVILGELLALPDKIQSILDQKNLLEIIAKKYSRYEDVIFIGRKYNYPVALEGALKLKEISYIHAEGYPAGELKHGPLALIDENFPVIAIIPKDSVYEKTLSNLQEIKARKGKIVAIVNQNDAQVNALAEDVFHVPETLEMLSPILTIIPLQFLAYYIAKERGCPIDQPRNLAKSVTVE